MSPEKVTALRKLFTSTSLSTALLSFISTMNGLQLYIFKDNFISAFVLSGAVQGALFGISTEFFLILSKFTKRFSKIFFIVIWFFLLLFSSGFSYVGISKTAYPDDVLREDAEQILIQYCLDTDYDLLNYIKKLEENFLVNFYNYLNVLNGSSENFSISKQDQDILEKQKQTLEDYQNTNEIDKGDGTKISVSDITATLNTEMLVTYINTIISGNYSNNLDAYKKALHDKISDAKKKKKDYDQKYDEENKLVVGDPNSDLDPARLGYNGRSSQYTNLSDPNFIKLQQDIAIAEENKSKFKSLGNKLDDFTKYLEQCKSFIENDFEMGAENVIYQQTIELKEEINKENINTNKVISTSEIIYDKLIENNTSSTDDKIKEYATFKNNVNEYKVIIEQKQKLKSEIDELNNYSSNSFLYTTKSATYVSTNQVDGSSDSMNDFRQTIWSNHLLEIQSILKNLPDEYTKTPSINDIISLPKNKTRYLEEISDRKRLYLTDINDFDRAWTLLFSNFHPLKYKLMLFVSVIIAFGLDLISFSMGCLLSKIKI